MNKNILIKSLLFSMFLAPCAYGMKKSKSNLTFYKGAKDVHYLAIKGNLNAIKYIIKANRASLEAKTFNKETPLHLAARHNQMDVIKYLLSERANIKAKNNNGDTPLHLAAKNNNAIIINLLIKFKANIEEKNSEGLTALHIAAYHGKEKAVKELVKLNANIEAKAKKEKNILLIKKENSCCDSNYESCDSDCGSCCDSSCNISCCDEGNEEKSCNECCCDCKDYGYEETPLILAAIANHKNIVKFLLSQNANPNATDDIKNTALHLTKNVNIAKALINFGAKIEIKNKWGDTPLLSSSPIEKTTNKIKFLLKSGANLEEKNNNKENIITTSCTSCEPNPKNIKLLIKRGAKFFFITEIINNLGEERYLLMTKSNNINAIHQTFLTHKKTIEILKKYVTYKNELYKAILEYKKEKKENTLKYLKKLIPINYEAIKKIKEEKILKKLNYIKKLMASNNVPTFTKKIALPILIKNSCKKELTSFFENISFDTTFLTRTTYKECIKYALENNLKDVNNRTITKAAKILKLEKNIRPIVEKVNMRKFFKKSEKSKNFDIKIVCKYNSNPTIKPRKNNLNNRPYRRKIERKKEDCNIL